MQAAAGYLVPTHKSFHPLFLDPVVVNVAAVFSTFIAPESEHVHQSKVLADTT